MINELDLEQSQHIDSYVLYGDLIDPEYYPKPMPDYKKFYFSYLEAKVYRHNNRFFVTLVYTDYVTGIISELGTLGFYDSLAETVDSLNLLWPTANIKTMKVVKSQFSDN